MFIVSVTIKINLFSVWRILVTYWSDGVYITCILTLYYVQNPMLLIYINTQIHVYVNIDIFP